MSAPKGGSGACDGSAPDPAALRLDAYLPYRLAAASAAVSQLIARTYETRFGLTIWQWRALAVLGEGEERTQRALMERTGMDKVTVSRAVQALMLRGLVTRRSSAADRRATLIGLSQAGADIYREIVPLARAYEDLLLQALTPDQARELDRLLRCVEARAQALRAR
jgi:DNA-binding MarR family transcriptional regulator